VNLIFLIFLSLIAVKFNMNEFDPSIFDSINDELDHYIRIRIDNGEGSDNLIQFLSSYLKN